MPRTIEYWRPTNGLYHATPPGIAVLTQDSDWEVLNEATGFYEESPPLRLQRDRCIAR
ncbi:hypothetical protein P4233_20270 [Pseudomonas aeruginosa]|nr:hypothetical protein [Pseudomonas aeruginosa]